MTKPASIFPILILLPSFAFAQYGAYGGNQRTTQVDGYYRQDGGYVQPHQRSAPNGTQTDNYNSQGNYNPNNGHNGTRQPRY